MVLCKKTTGYLVKQAFRRQISDTEAKLHFAYTSKNMTNNATAH